MWGNISGVVGAAIQKVQKISSEIESQMDQAVGAEGGVPSSTAAIDSNKATTSEQPPSIPHNNVSFSSVDLQGDQSQVNTPEASSDSPKVKAVNAAVKRKDTSSTPKDDTTNSAAQSTSTSPVNMDEYISRKKHEDLLSNLKEECKSRMRNLKKEQEKEMSSMKEQMKQLQESNQKELETAIANTKSSLTLLHEKEIKSLEASFEAEKESLLQKIDNLEKRHVATISSMESDFQSKMERSTLSWEAKLAEALASTANHVEGDTPVPAPNEESNKWKDLHSKLETNLSETQSKLKKIEDDKFNVEEECRKLKETVAKVEASLQESKIAVEKLTLEQQGAHEGLRKLEQEKKEVLQDLAKVKEVVAERERALESSVEKAAELNKLYDDAQQKVSDLKSEIAEKDARLRQAQSHSADESDLKKDLVKLQEEIRIKDERLNAFEAEGRNLSKKQSEMEKNVRKSKQELREKETEITKLKESKDQLVKALEQTQEALKKQELDSLNSSKTLSAMQAVSQASADKLAKLEAEIHAKTEELSSQRRALENAWSDNNELKRLITELKAERDDLKKQLGEGTSKVLETESSRREIEQREAVLRATSRQLQESLQNQMKESSMREERLREEIQEMRRRWQEAVAARESITSELSQTTAPLLRQISSLQETLRIKSEQWQNVESSLSERALRAENAVESFEHKKSLYEEQITALRQQLSVTASRLQDHQSQLQLAETAIDRFKRQEMAWSEERHELESKLSLESAQKSSLQTTLREMEIRHKLELQEQHDSLSIQMTNRELEIAKLKRDYENALEELKSERHYNKNRKGHTSKMPTFQNGGEFRNLEDTIMGDENGRDHIPLSATLPSGDISFMAAEKMNLRNRQRDEELLSLQTQVQQLQTSRNALLDEVSFLSARNAQLEEDTTDLPALREELQSSKKQIDVLLVLLGEKEEELEAILMDMKEVKNMYTAHMEELLEKITFNSDNQTHSKSAEDSNNNLSSASISPSKSVTNFAGATIPAKKE